MKIINHLTKTWQRMTHFKGESMKKIRLNIFETNSSSTHSITMYGRNNFVKPTSTIFVHFGEFGWEVETFRDWHDKLSYVLTAIQYHIHIPQDQITKKTILESKYGKWLLEMIKDYCGMEVIVSDCGGYFSVGYIDHESVYVLEWPETENVWKESMKNFIFNTRYILHTDNDNY